MFHKHSFTLFHNKYFSRLLKVKSITTCAKNHLEKQNQRQILQNYLGISSQRTNALLRNHNFLQTIDNIKFENSVKSLVSVGISSEDIYKHPMSLLLHQNTIEHNFKYLQEVGFTHISAHILLKFRSIVKKPIVLLKAHGIISENVNIPKRMYSYLDPKPDYFPVLQKFTDEDTIIRVHEAILKNYLVWKFNTTIREIDRVFKIYDRFQYKSFNLICQTIQIITEDLGFTNERLLHNGYLFQSNPEYIKQHMTLIPKLAGINIKNVLYKFPKLIATSPNNILAIDKHLRDFGITDEAIRKCFEIYTLAPETVLYRLNELKEIPEFDALSKNIRIVSLIFNQNKAKLRLEYLQKLKVKCASINVLCASDTVFEKYAQEGNDRTKGSDLIGFICQELNISEKEIRNKLSSNPHWCHVPLISVQNTLNYLLTNRFSKSEIRQMPIILVYPKKQIRDALREIELNPETSNIKLNSTSLLNLCMYFIEKKHHFSGDGLWENLPVETSASN